MVPMPEKHWRAGILLPCWSWGEGTITEGQGEIGQGRTFFSVVACTSWSNAGDPVSSVPGCGAGLLMLPEHIRASCVTHSGPHFTGTHPDRHADGCPASSAAVPAGAEFCFLGVREHLRIPRAPPLCRPSRAGGKLEFWTCWASLRKKEKPKSSQQGQQTYCSFFMPGPKPRL